MAAEKYIHTCYNMSCSIRVTGLRAHEIEVNVFRECILQPPHILFYTCKRN